MFEVTSAFCLLQSQGGTTVVSIGKYDVPFPHGSQGSQVKLCIVGVSGLYVLQGSQVAQGLQASHVVHGKDLVLCSLSEVVGSETYYKKLYHNLLLVLYVVFYRMAYVVQLDICCFRFRLSMSCCFFVNWCI